MNILLSNDDGYRAKGIRILGEVLSSRGHRVSVCAPESEQSGKSHGMTIAGRVVLEEYSPGCFHLAGTPADCIVYSHRCALFPQAFDAVISGINHGYNLSTDIIYSGTCAAARQAALYGMRSIALSAASGDECLIRKAAGSFADHLGSFLAAIPAGTFMNINFPESFHGGYMKAGIGAISYSDNVAVREEDGTRRVLEIEYADLGYEPSRSHYRADFEVCREGMASVSIIDIHPSLSEAMESLSL